MPARPIFRDSALEAYRRRTEKDVVPRVITTPIVVGFWVLLATFATIAVMAWLVRVPTYVAGSGAVVGPRDAVLFLPPGRSAQLRVGRPVEMQIGSAGTPLRGALMKVQPGVIGPAAARKRYRLEGADLITEPSSVVLVRLGRTLPSAAFRGSHLTARVSTGSQRLLERFSVVGSVVGSER